MDVSILTPVHNDESFLERSLRATLAQNTDLEFEVIAIDDGSIDASPQILERMEKQEPRLKVIAKPAGGEASALNAGLEQAGAELIAILEADVEAESDWLSILCEAIGEPGAMGAGGMLLTPREDPWIARIAGYEVEYRQSRQSRYVHHITSANALYRREAFGRHGAFKDNLINSCLDVDFNQRLIAAGHKLVFEPRAKVRHHYKGSFWSYLKRQYAYARYRPFLQNLHLYERDVTISMQLGLSLLTIANLALLPLSVWPFLVMLLLTFLSSLPVAVPIYKQKRDNVMLLFPFVMFGRSIAGLMGLARGYLAKMLQGGSAEDAAV